MKASDVRSLKRDPSHCRADSWHTLGQGELSRRSGPQIAPLPSDRMTAAGDSTSGFRPTDSPRGWIRPERPLLRRQARPEALLTRRLVVWLTGEVQALSVAIAGENSPCIEIRLASYLAISRQLCAVHRCGFRKERFSGRIPFHSSEVDSADVSAPALGHNARSPRMSHP